MRKIVLTDEVAKALDQIWNWAKCEASTVVALPVWQVICKAVEEEELKDCNEKKDA